jgi:hypothetical protein
MGSRTILSLLIALVLFVLSSIYMTHRGKYRARASPIAAEHLAMSKVREAMVTLGSDVFYQVWTKSTNVTNYTQYWLAVETAFPELQISPNSTNPFPEVLPAGQYRLASEFPFQSSSKRPFLWTVMPERGQSFVILLTLSGEYEYITWQDFTNQFGSNL